ncbi:hypothetical protein JYU34_010997 [Plutella xylostella]|uniref:Uncharacterized protein n=2 Tax=Plutella xylostella TaxID=51655 RepID=A0ABQ7QFS7_PLUXY|nr:protein obstructor-E [Plutella xylostella]KAG7304067.1 hypothetical protein JYU34_010997 [Plutella xylostella]CAG9110458.1 unnamed protein product [Plutella xylostella]
MFRFLCLAVIAVASCNGQAVVAPKSSICAQRNNYYKVDGKCDAYIECKDFVAHEMLCPDGLHFDPRAAWPAYPCGYAIDISCDGRGQPQPAIPSAECPHQYGFYASPQASVNDCGQYRMCVEGKAIEMMCPPGLAFNPATARCDWPEFVSSCNVEAFLGFKCPVLPPLENGEPNTAVVNYKYEGNCFAFYSCELGRPRLLTCDAGFAFNPATGVCEDADKVQCK